MRTGTKHKTLKCKEKSCQRYGEPLEWSNIYGKYMCPDSLIANGED